MGEIDGMAFATEYLLERGGCVGIILYYEEVALRTRGHTDKARRARCRAGERVRRR